DHGPHALSQPHRYRNFCPQYDHGTSGHLRESQGLEAGILSGRCWLPARQDLSDPKYQQMEYLWYDYSADPDLGDPTLQCWDLYGHYPDCWWRRPPGDRHRERLQQGPGYRRSPVWQQ